MDPIIFIVSLLCCCGTPSLAMLVIGLIGWMIVRHQRENERLKQGQEAVDERLSKSRARPPPTTAPKPPPSPPPRWKPARLFAPGEEEDKRTPNLDELEREEVPGATEVMQRPGADEAPSIAAPMLLDTPAPAPRRYISAPTLYPVPGSGEDDSEEPTHHDEAPHMIEEGELDEADWATPEHVPPRQPVSDLRFGRPPAPPKKR